MHPFRTLALLALALTLPVPALAEGAQADRYFVLWPLDAGPRGEFVVRISESARAMAFEHAWRARQPVRLAARIVQRGAAWNPGWPFYSERHGVLPSDTLITRCSTHAPARLAAAMARGARLHGSAWCPAVRVVREIKP